MAVSVHLPSRAVHGSYPSAFEAAIVIKLPGGQRDGSRGDFPPDGESPSRMPPQHTDFPSPATHSLLAYFTGIEYHRSPKKSVYITIEQPT